MREYPILALSVDTDDFYNMPGVSGSPFSLYPKVSDFFIHWKDRYDYLTSPTYQLLSILQKYQIKATFFIIADQTNLYPGLVETISSHGHEIACHGLYHENNIHPDTKTPLLSITEFEERTGKAKEVLEKISGKPVVGYRAPNAYIAGWMIDSLEKLGFIYDSSVAISSIHNKTPEKVHHLTSEPYYPVPGSIQPGTEPRKIIEIPLPYLSILNFKIPVGGGPFLRFFGSSMIIAGLNQCLKRGDTIFYLHSIDISDETFPTITSSRRRFYWLIKGNIIINRMIKIINTFKPHLGTCIDIANKKRRQKSNDEI